VTNYFIATYFKDNIDIKIILEMMFKFDNIIMIKFLMYFDFTHQLKY